MKKISFNLWWVFQDKGFLRYFKNTGWLLFEQLLRVTSGLFVGFWVARFLGPEQFGLFSYSIAFVAMLTGLAKVGLDSILVKEFVDSRFALNLLLGTALWLKLAGALVAILTIAIAAFFLSNENSTNLLIGVAALSLIFLAFEVVDFYFQAMVQVRVVSIIRSVGLLFSALLRICLILIDADLVWLVAAVSVDAIFVAVCYFLVSKACRLPNFVFIFDLSVAKSLLRQSWPLLLSTVVVGIYMRIDQVMIKNIRGDYDAGIYSAAVRISEGFYFVPVLIAVSLYPAILNARSISLDLYLNRIQRLYVFMVWVAIFIATVISFFGNDLIQIAFGNGYTDASPVLLTHVWAAIFVFLGVSFEKCLIAEGLAKIAFSRALLGVVINIVLNLFLIPTYGTLGAAISTLLAQFFANLGYDFFDPRLRVHLKLKLNAFFRPWVVFKSA